MKAVVCAIPAVDGSDPGAARVVRLLPEASPSTNDLARVVVAQTEGDCAPAGRPG